MLSSHQRVLPSCSNDGKFSVLCSDGFRDYEPDYSATLSAEEVQHQTEEGGRKRREAEKEDGRRKHLLMLDTLLFSFILRPLFLFKA